MFTFYLAEWYNSISHNMKGLIRGGKIQNFGC